MVCVGQLVPESPSPVLAVFIPMQQTISVVPATWPSFALILRMRLSVVGNGRTGRKLCVYLKVTMQKERTSEVEEFLRKQIKTSAQRSEVRGGTVTRKALSLVNLIHTFC